jgi:hypothetical protein
VGGLARIYPPSNKKLVGGDLTSTLTRLAVRCDGHTLLFRATSHMRLRARVKYTSSTLISGKGAAGPSSLHTTLEGPNILDECKMDVESTWILSYMASNGPCFMITWIIFIYKPSLGDRPNTKLGDHGTLHAHNHWFILFNHV